VISYREIVKVLCRSAMTWWWDGAVAGDIFKMDDADPDEDFICTSNVYVILTDQVTASHAYRTSSLWMIHSLARCAVTENCPFLVCSFPI
jgi:hypothetical protein